MSTTNSETTRLLIESEKGDSAAAEQLLPSVYRELRAIAQRMMRAERVDHTLQPTAVVHEAYLRLIDNDRMDWKGRTHFIAMAAGALRRVLVDSARARRSIKRGGDVKRVTRIEVASETKNDVVDLLVLEDALIQLGQNYPRATQVVELRFFGGLTIEETAHALEITERTVSRHWTFARAWLNSRMTSGLPDPCEPDLSPADE